MTRVPNSTTMYSALISDQAPPAAICYPGAECSAAPIIRSSLHELHQNQLDNAAPDLESLTAYQEGETVRICGRGFVPSTFEHDVHLE